MRSTAKDILSSSSKQASLTVECGIENSGSTLRTTGSSVMTLEASESPVAPPRTSPTAKTSTPY